MRALLVVFVFIIISCKGETGQADLISNNDEEVDYIAAPFEIYDFEGLKPFLKTNTDKIYVVNFWATWCAPCVKELPYFEALNSAYSDQNVEVLLVSLDFPKKYETHVKPFIIKHQLKSKVVALNDMDSNTWIPEIHPEWSGAIPATLIFNKDKRQFYEQTFTYDELVIEVSQFLKSK